MWEKGVQVTGFEDLCVLQLKTLGTPEVPWSVVLCTSTKLEHKMLKSASVWINLDAKNFKDVSKITKLAIGAHCSG